MLPTKIYKSQDTFSLKFKMLQLNNIPRSVSSYSKYETSTKSVSGFHDTDFFDDLLRTNTNALFKPLFLVTHSTSLDSSAAKHFHGDYERFNVAFHENNLTLKIIIITAL